MRITKVGRAAQVPAVTARRRARFSRRWEEWKINNRNRPYRLLCARGNDAIRQSTGALSRTRPRLIVFSLLLTASTLCASSSLLYATQLSPTTSSTVPYRVDSAATRFRHWRSTAIIDSVVSDRVSPWRECCDFSRKTPSHFDVAIRPALAANSKRKQREADRVEG